jgi:hypothetical protein
MWNMKYFVIPVITGAIGIVTKELKSIWKQYQESHSVDSVQKTAVLGTSHILRTVLQSEN